jgi:hypothetical protein
MANRSPERPHRHQARLLLLALVAIPLLPEMVIGIAAALAGLMGCRLDQTEPCLIGSLAVSDIISWALQAGAGFILVRIKSSAFWSTGFYLAVGMWLVVCYVVLIQGWSRVASRLLLGFALAFLFALLPYDGPRFAITNLAKKGFCEPTAGGTDVCEMFGRRVEGADAAVLMGEPILHFAGILLAIAIFAVFAIIVLVSAAAARRRAKSQADYA